MSVFTLEGIVENGHIRLQTDIQLPDNTRVFVLVPDIEVKQTARVYSPRLVHPEEIEDFRMEIIEEPHLQWDEFKRK